jgi:hypothetical protein
MADPFQSSILIDRETGIAGAVLNESRGGSESERKATTTQDETDRKDFFHSCLFR